MQRILLAEDDESMRRFLVKALERAGYSVVSFADGAQAYNRLREEPFTLLLTDIVMPEMDGIELARRASELDPELKIMFITGFAAVALNSEESAAREAKVLSKPFHLRDLVDEVDRMLDIGFRDDIKAILSTVTGEHQTIFVSATIDDEIKRLAGCYM